MRPPQMAQMPLMPGSAERIAPARLQGVEFAPVMLRLPTDPAPETVPPPVLRVAASLMPGEVRAGLMRWVVFAQLLAASKLPSTARQTYAATVRPPQRRIGTRQFNPVRSSHLRSLLQRCIGRHAGLRP